MSYIKELSEDLIKKIAAGEVIERPASVVKELVENSIDAKSTRIEVEIKRSGKYIKIQDDGVGIHSEDIPLLFTRHATSKLNSFEDLWSIDTLGFRGEALASVSSISKVTCSSKNENDDCGFEITLREGKLNKKSSGISKGTVFEIDDLFYNVPAREKFLKAASTEVGHVSDVVLSQALAHPEISFVLKNNNNVLLSTTGSGDLSQAIVEIVGDDLRDKVIPIKSSNKFLDFSGYVSALEVFRSNRKFLFTFVNSRPVKCPILLKAISNSYEGLLPPGKSPIVILNLDFKPNFVDVNVHPTKKEVRYTNPSDVYNLVLKTLQTAISDYYKKVYKDKAPITFPEPEEESFEPASVEKPSHTTSNYVPEIERPSESYSQAAFELYAPTENEKSEEPESFVSDETPSEKTHIFSVGNLKCYITGSLKPVANMTKIGNKTIFEVGHIFDESQIVFSGEVSGSDDYQREFFDGLSELGSSFYKLQELNKLPIQPKIIDKEVEEDTSKKQTSRTKPSLKVLKEVWDRDNWTCVYCSKQLIDPEVAKKAIRESEDGFTTYINKDGKEVTEHVIKKHAATYDHYLPYSKTPQFKVDADNLYASCIECNCKKSDSMNLETWKPEVADNWTEPLEVANLIFESPLKYKVKASNK